MSFDPFDSKEVNVAVKKHCKGKSLKGLEKLFKQVVDAEMTIDNLHPGGVSVKLSDQCIALAEVVAAGRGHGKAVLPEVAEKWLENAPDFDDDLTAVAKAAVDKVRSNSGARSIVEEMGGWPAWTGFVRGLSTRLAKKPKQRKPAKKLEGAAAAARALRTLGCDLRTEGKDVTNLYTGRDAKVDDEAVELIAQLKTLKILALTQQPLTDRSLPLLSSLKNLEILTMVDCNVKGSGFKDLVLPRLRDFSFGESGVNTVIKNFAGLSKVREAHFRMSDLTDAGLKGLATAKALATLNVSDCEKLKGAGFKALQDLKKLRSITAKECSFSPAGFKALCGLTNLTSLSLADAKVPAKSLKELANLKKLTHLDLRGLGVEHRQLEFLTDLRKLTSLDLFRNRKVTDETVAMLAKLPSLKELDLGATAVTEASLETLRGMKSLREVGLYNADVPDKAKKKFERELAKRGD